MKIEIMTLILALIQIESGGNDKAIGDSGKAYGCLHDVAWASGIPYAHEEAFDRQKAIDMFLIYMSLYATEGRLNREPKAILDADTSL
jgi:hypothetical protein